MDVRLVGNVAEVIREFPWDNYGFDDIDIALREQPLYQDWVQALAERIVKRLQSEKDITQWPPLV